MKKILLAILFPIAFWTYGQNEKKDTLFFELDRKFINQHEDSNEYYVKWDSRSDSDWISFIKRETLKSVNHTEIKNLRDHIYWVVYTTRPTRPLAEYELADLLNNSVIFFVEGELFHRVDPTYSIE